MNIAKTVEMTIERIPPGEIFGYEAFSNYQKAPEAVIRAVNRRVENHQVKRLSKGRFYTPKKGVLGDVKVNDNEILRDALFRKGQRRCYITGAALYNRLGLTTQIPKTISVAANRAAQTKDFGTIRIKYVPRRAPINESTIPLLELLDVLRDAKSVPGANTTGVVDTTSKHIADLSISELKKLQKLALDYYNAGTRALLGMILDANSQLVLPKLRESINPTTRFEIGMDKSEWPQARAWNIR